MLITGSRPTDFLSQRQTTSYIIIFIQENAIDIRIRDSILTKVSTVKFLAVTLDENLTFNGHVKNITTKISKSVCVMRRLHCQLPADVMIKLLLFFGAFPSDLCVTDMGKIGTYKCC